MSNPFDKCLDNLAWFGFATGCWCCDATLIRAEIAAPILQMPSLPR
jgi:hypothetical protein